MSLFLGKVGSDGDGVLFCSFGQQFSSVGMSDGLLQGDYFVVVGTFFGMAGLKDVGAGAGVCLKQ